MSSKIKVLCNFFRMLEPEWWVFISSQSDTSTDGVEVMSQMWEPGRKSTVLAHNDLDVEAPGFHEMSRGAGQSFKSSTWTNTIGFSGPFCMSTVWPVACRTTWLGLIHGDPNLFTALCNDSRTWMYATSKASRTQVGMGVAIYYVPV